VAEVIRDYGFENQDKSGMAADAARTETTPEMTKAPQ
jgi:hypothetical protein